MVLGSLWGGTGGIVLEEVSCYPDPVVYTQNNKCARSLFLQYVRVSSDTPPRVIYHLMTQHWGLDPPNLLISVTGGAKNFGREGTSLGEWSTPGTHSHMGEAGRRLWAEPLPSHGPLCPLPGAWIITGGSHAGVMKQVGEAVRDFMLSCSHKEGDIVTIGIATWGTVYNRESLGGFPAEYVLDEENQGSLSCLDSNHSHFILVDDGTHGRYGVEIPLRTRLEKFISEQTKVKGGNGNTQPGLRQGWAMPLEWCPSWAPARGCGFPRGSRHSV
ncbi:hypothetical protein EK904_000221 [Melospiza melodia maxima]|nr:hypothetical protein EK904_000221 [Melospiza melodia maxima]